MMTLKQQFKKVETILGELAKEGGGYTLPETAEDALDLAIINTMELRMKRRGLFTKYQHESAHGLVEWKVADLYKTVIMSQLIQAREKGVLLDFDQPLEGQDRLLSEYKRGFADKLLLQVTMNLCQSNLEGTLTMQYVLFLQRTLLDMYPNLVDLLMLRLAQHVYENGVCYGEKPLDHWWIGGNKTHQDIVDYIAKWDTPDRLNGVMAQFLKSV